MTGTKHQLKTTEAATTRKQKNRKQQPSKTAQDAVQIQRSKRASPKEISAVFTQRALAGDVECAKLLFTVADRTKPPEPPKKKRRGLTYAQQLALDPPWQGESPTPFVSIYDAKPNPD